VAASFVCTREIPPFVATALTLIPYLVAFAGVFGPPWGITGMWLMQSLALALAALLLVGFFIGRPSSG
jgi:hypothetical protein